MHAKLIDDKEPWMYCSAAEQREAVCRVIKSCTNLERAVLGLTYRMEDGREYTIEEVGRILGRCRESVRTIQVRAIDRISRTDRREALLPFVDKGQLDVLA